MNIENLLSLIGGLGLFLYGMTVMGDSIEKAAGAKMRSFLDFFTKNRFIGMLFGMLFCAIVQSSSATTVMVVSFVNAGLMNLVQAAGVIMGANVGTTITSQLVAFNLSQAAPVFLMLGVIVTMFCKNNKVKQIGEVVLGFGVLFMGLSLMSGSMEGMKESPFVVELLHGINNPFLGILIGFVITAIIQSSSVTVSIVLLMAQQGLLPLWICFYIILGCNIGSCTTALLASISGNKDAKRAAMIHFLFNVMGTIVIAAILLLGESWVEAGIRRISGDNIGRCVANAHTFFKVFQVIILFPFAKQIVKLTYLFVPDKGEKDKQEGFQLEYIGPSSVFSPNTAVVEVTKELERMGHIAVENLTDAVNVLMKPDDKGIEKVYETEKQINYMNHAITDYLVKISQSTLPMDDMKNIGGLFHVVNDIERIGDHAENAADSAVLRKEKNISFSKEGETELLEMLSRVIKITNYSIDMFSNNSKEHLQEILDLENGIDQMERDLQEAHVERLKKGKCKQEAGMIFSDIISGLERVADHATNIAFSILDEEPEE
ncbi:MAG: Na/Pi cotransporter family protein [Bacillota bacterium]|nr:Na/Pi cotransporter family protein [Bacillota bacterium]